MESTTAPSEAMTDKDLLTVLPEFGLIQDADLRSKAMSVWTTLAEQSRFASISDVPVRSSFAYPHIPHNRSVVHMVVKVAEVLEEFHGVEINKDLLVTAALLQDVAKLVEYEPADGDVRMTEIGNRFQHGFYGAHAALNAGLPLEVVESILDHTHASGRFPQTLIAKILFYVDQIDMAALEGDRWKKVGVIYR
jgi:HD domain